MVIYMTTAEIYKKYAKQRQELEDDRAAGRVTQGEYERLRDEIDIKEQAELIRLN